MFLSSTRGLTLSCLTRSYSIGNLLVGAPQHHSLLPRYRPSLVYHRYKFTSAPQFSVQLINYRRLPYLDTTVTACYSANSNAKPLIMSSDDAYSSFLDQANQDTGAGKASAQSKRQTASTKAVDTDVPAVLQKVEQYYTSEADEPFEPVSLEWSGKNMPSEST